MLKCAGSCGETRAMEAASRWVDILWSMGVANKTAEWDLRSWAIERGTATLWLSKSCREEYPTASLTSPQIEH